MTIADHIDLMDLTPFAAGTDGALFACLRNDDPLHWNEEPDGPGFWSVTRYDDIKTVAADAETFSVTDGTQIQSRRAEGEGARSIHHVDPPEHTKLRGIVTPQIRPVKLKASRATSPPSSINSSTTPRATTASTSSPRWPRNCHW